MLAAHCPASVAKVSVLLGDHRITSPEELAQWSSKEAVESSE